MDLLNDLNVLTYKQLKCQKICRRHKHNIWGSFQFIRNKTKMIGTVTLCEFSCCSNQETWRSLSGFVLLFEEKVDQSIWRWHVWNQSPGLVWLTAPESYDLFCLGGSEHRAKCESISMLSVMETEWWGFPQERGSSLFPMLISGGFRYPNINGSEKAQSLLGSGGK